MTRQAVTTKANYQQRLLSVSLKELSTTFQDAIWLTRRLGIRYIWIDSLCIVQDDKRDWENEAMRMAQLYSAAYLTIAAGYGANGQAGVLYKSPDGAHAQLRILLRHPDQDAEEVTVSIIPWHTPADESPVHDMYGFFSGTYYYSDKVHQYVKDPLLGRGWAFQERILSTRIVHFTQGELVWECREVQSCECGYLDGKHELETALGFITAEDAEEEEASSSSEDDSHSTASDAMETGSNMDGDIARRESSIDELWWRLVEQFTSRELTKLEDRGPAFAGIARSFGKQAAKYPGGSLSGELGVYCAGMWLEHLPYSLFWSSSTATEAMPAYSGRSQRIKDCMAPSWSWYSVSGTCRFLGNHTWFGSSLYLEKHVEECDASYEFDAPTGSPFGGLTRGAITLSGIGVCTVTRASESVPFSLKLRSRDQLSDVCKVEILADDPEDGKHVGDMVCLYLYSGRHTLAIRRNRPEYPVWYDTPDPSEDDWYEEDEAAWCEANYAEYPIEVECKEHFVGLALLPVYGQVHTFRRIGLFHAEGLGCMGLREVGDAKTVAAEDILPSSGAAEEWIRNIEMKDQIILT